MKMNSSPLSLALLFAASTLVVPALADNPRYSLVIALDGVRADTMFNGDNTNIESLINNTWASGYNTAYSYSAQTGYNSSTYSGPNHVGIMTGIPGGSIGVTDNSNITSGNFASYPHYLSRIETAAPTRNTAYLVSWGSDYTQIPYSGSLPTTRVFANNPSNPDVTNTGIASQMLAGTYSGTATNGATWSAGATPDAVFLFLDDPDHAGHTYGFDPNVAQYKGAVATADAQIGQLLNAIRSRSNFANEDWQIVITADHGGMINGSHDSGNPGTGGTTANHTTIPFIVSSKTAQAGVLTGSVRNYDAATTALDHLGVAYPTGGDANALTGVARGASVDAKTSPNLANGLVSYLKFDGTLADASGRGNHATAQGTNAPVAGVSGGKFGGALQLNGASSYATLGNPDDLKFAAGDDYSISLWFKSPTIISGDAAIISNKNWANGRNTGFVLGPGKGGTGGSAGGIGFNLGDGTNRADINAISYSANAWTYIAVIVSKDGTAILYSGGEDGVLRWIAFDVSNIGTMVSGLPLNIGQDGSGVYSQTISGQVDDLGIWRRGLSHDEVTSLYGDGAGASIESRIAAVPEPSTYGVAGAVALALAALRRRRRK